MPTCLVVTSAPNKSIGRVAQTVRTAQRCSQAGEWSAVGRAATALAGLSTEAVAAPFILSSPFPIPLVTHYEPVTVTRRVGRVFEAHRTPRGFVHRQFGGPRRLGPPYFTQCPGETELGSCPASWRSWGR